MASSLLIFLNNSKTTAWMVTVRLFSQRGKNSPSSDDKLTTKSPGKLENTNNTYICSGKTANEATRYMEGHILSKMISLLTNTRYFIII